jgi:hypothetical protein
VQYKIKTSKGMNIVHNTYLGTLDLGNKVSYLLEGEFLHYCWVAIIVNIEQCFIKTIAFNGSKGPKEITSDFWLKQDLYKLKQSIYEGR